MQAIAPTGRFFQTYLGRTRRVGRLHPLQIGYGFSSAARGSDLLFVEELMKTGGSCRVFLPFPREDFKRSSVGHGWDVRFDNALKDAELIELSAEVPP
jgi:hypothetical protein